MQGRVIGGATAIVCVLGLWTTTATAQISLADDIISAAAAAQTGKAERPESAVGPPIGTAETPFKRRPGSTNINISETPQRRRAALPRLARLVTSASAFSAHSQEPGPGRFEEGIAPSIERLPLALPDGAASRIDDPAGYDDEGPADGLTLDDALRRLVESNKDLRIKAMELPQADADILTAGLRDNPLIFYGSDQVPYGSYSPQRNGDIEHGVSLVFPIDYMGKRRKRVNLAKAEKDVLAAQYQNAVREAIDQLYTSYVNALVARQSMRAAEDSLSLLADVIKVHSARIAPGMEPSEEELDQMDDLVVERGITEMAVQDARDRYHEARHQLSELLEIEREQTHEMELHGKINVPRPILPAVEELIATAKERRPDLIAHRLGVARARAEWMEERGERYSDAYFLYTPWNYQDRSQSRELSVSNWGAGVFVTIPLFNRNQGNVRRAEINVAQSQVEAEVIEGQVEGEVRHAYTDLANSLEDIQRLEKETLPAVRRKRDKARVKLEAREIGSEDYLRVQRQTTSLVRFYRDTAARNRRNMLKLNTAVGARILP